MWQFVFWVVLLVFAAWITRKHDPVLSQVFRGILGTFLVISAMLYMLENNL